MILKAFVVYDSKVENYDVPRFAKTRGEFLRNLSSVLNDENHVFCKHAADFTFFEIGDYRTDTGEFIEHAAKVNLGTALELKAV